MVLGLTHLVGLYEIELLLHYVEIVKPIISFAEQFLEVACRSSGKLRRFAAGTEAGFASNLINRKLGAGTQPSLYIEAVKEGEEPVSFGPNSVLLNYGEGWKLQTVLAEGICLFQLEGFI